MPDYRREIKFGYFLVPNAADPLLDTAREVERRGLDYVAVQDHPYQRRYVDTWTLLSMIAGSTSRVGLFPDVANLPLRPPAVLAKAAASLDLLSGGRAELGLGAGGFWDAIGAYGGPRRGPGDALAALAEAIQVIRLVWSGQRNLRFEGEHYRLAGAQSGPVPAHPVGIWLGVYGPKALRLAGRVADGWVPSLRGDREPIRDMARGRSRSGGDPPGAQRGRKDHRWYVRGNPHRPGRPVGRRAGRAGGDRGLRYLRVLVGGAGSAGPVRRGGRPGGPGQRGRPALTTTALPLPSRYPAALVSSSASRAGSLNIGQ
jgi:alkanesulfonate monooxygenase SsuD/methylene tetrahydromethanopterin reductase-like flavin-dependent oxidoreductase (luciferase family)